MEDLNKLLEYCHSNIGRYFFKNQIQTLFDDECNFAFDIEACPTDETKEEMYTYSLSFMSCDIQNNVCYNFDDIILKHKSFKRLRLSDNNARKEHLKYMKELTKGMSVKNFESWFVENKGASDWFKNEYLKGHLFDDLTDKDINTLMDYFNSLSGIKKELVIKQALNKIKEKYENSDDPTAYKFKAYNQVMSNLINYGKNDEVS